MRKPKTQSQTHIFKPLFALAMLLLTSPSVDAKARSGKAHSVGTGIVYPTLNHSLFVNPAGLADSPKASLQGAYMLDPEDVHASATFGSGSLGFGAGWRQFGGTSIENLGLAFKANILTLGVASHSSEFDNFGFDIGATFDLGSMRAGVVVRDITGDFKRYDFGLGFLLNQATVEVNAKLDSDSDLAFDFGVSVGTKVAVGVGYAFYLLDGSVANDTFHAGISAAITNGFALEAFYRPHPFEWSTGDWVVGAKVEL